MKVHIGFMVTHLLCSHLSLKYQKQLQVCLKGYSGVSLIHVLTHLDTELDQPSRDKFFRPLANVALASSEMTARQQYIAVNGSKYKLPSKSHKSSSEQSKKMNKTHLSSCRLVVGTRCHSVLEHGLNLHRNIPLIAMKENTKHHLCCTFSDFK